VFIQKVRLNCELVWSKKTTAEKWREPFDPKRPASPSKPISRCRNREQRRRHFLTRKLLLLLLMMMMMLLMQAAVIHLLLQNVELQKTRDAAHERAASPPISCERWAKGNVRVGDAARRVKNATPHLPTLNTSTLLHCKAKRNAIANWIIRTCAKQTSSSTTPSAGAPTHQHTATATSCMRLGPCTHVRGKRFGFERRWPVPFHSAWLHRRPFA
jgi:hypothetical protein